MERRMNWHLSWSTDSVQIGMFTAVGFPYSVSTQPVLCLHPGLVEKEVPTGETPTMAWTFLNYFVKVEGNYPAKDFRHPDGSTCRRSSGGARSWITHWRNLRLNWCGIEISSSNFFAILELYCPWTGTIFTPKGELGLALYEMWEVSMLPIGNLLYEEYISCSQELSQLSSLHMNLYKTY